MPHLVFVFVSVKFRHCFSRQHDIIGPMTFKVENVTQQMCLVITEKRALADGVISRRHEAACEDERLYVQARFLRESYSSSMRDHCYL